MGHQHGRCSGPDSGQSEWQYIDTQINQVASLIIIGQDRVVGGDGGHDGSVGTGNGRTVMVMVTGGNVGTTLSIKQKQAQPRVEQRHDQ